MICHTIYKTVSAFTTVKGVGNKQVRCDNFQIDRGVLQEGDIISLLFFILTLELILGRHDPNPAGQGVPLADNTLIRLLGYEDDLAVTKVGEEDGVCRIEKSVNDIAKGSSDDTDMQVNTEKTKSMHVREQDKTSPTTHDETTWICKFHCPHLNFGFRFLTKHGIKVHPELIKDYELSNVVYVHDWKCRCGICDLP